MKEPVSSSPEKEPSFTKLASPFKKGVSKTGGDCAILPVYEKSQSLDFAMGIAETYFSTEYWKSNISSESIHLKEEHGRKHSQDLGFMEQKTPSDIVPCNEPKTVAGNSLSQKDPGLNNMGSHTTVNLTNLSLAGASSTICYDVPDFHSTQAMQDSDISCLINEVSLTNDSDAGSSVSALIGQMDVTDDQLNLTGVSSPPGISTKKMTMRLVHSPQTLPNYPSTTYDYQSPIVYSTPEATMTSTPETTECSLYTVLHEASLSSASNHEFVSKHTCQNTNHCAEDTCALLSCISSASMRKANPKRKCGTNWESLGNSCLSDSSDLENTIVVPLACINSTGSSLMEADGTLQDLLITAYEYKREDMSHLASPLKLKHNQDTLQYNERICGNLNREDLHSAELVKESKYSSEKNRYLPYPEHQSVAHLCKNYLQISEAQNDFLNMSQRANVGSSSMPKHALPLPPTAQTQPSPCKSKSLGDLTSEDISCNFESKYKYISKGFITSGMRDKMAAALKAKKPQDTNSLTEQLRKLVSFDQEEGCPPFCSQQNDDCPKMLVRKLSSRSQSRVRNIASRAKERQEANKQQQLSNAVSHVTGVVLRNKPSVLPHIVNRHSTGSYIASYLDTFNADNLERRGVPEGACTTLRNGYNDRFYTDDSLLETKSSEDDKPEIYFLLRL